jgi:hypothetical protein
MILLYDGCHKIYYAREDETDTIAEFLGYGYEKIIGNFETNVRDLYTSSCFLRFISPANLDFNRPHVSQGAESQLVDDEASDEEFDAAMGQTVDKFLEQMKG